MAVYSVYQRPGDEGAVLADRLDRAAYVKDGFSWPAFLLGPIWLVRYRLWWPAAAWLGAVVVLPALMTSLLGLADVGGWVWLAAAAILGFEAADLRRTSLEWQGYREVAILKAGNLDECEIKFAHLAAGRGH